MKADAHWRSDLDQNKNYGGKSMIISGTMDELSTVDFNDRTSSLCVPAGFLLKTFDAKGFTGKETDYTGPTMIRALPDDNDKISSVLLIDTLTMLQVFDAPQICAQRAVVFQESFFRKLGLFVDATIPDLSKVTFNYSKESDISSKTTVSDKISSICVPAGRTLTLFRDKKASARTR